MKPMLEKGNCPVCGTTCVLEEGVEETTGFEDGKEIMYATCKTCKTRWRRREDAQIVGKLIYEKWAWRIPGINIQIPVVGGGFKTSPKGGRWIKVKEKQLPVDSLRETETEELDVKSGKTYKATVSIEPRKYSFYEFRLSKGNKVRGEITSDIPIDVFFLDMQNMDRLDRDVRFQPTEATEAPIYEYKPEFTATKKDVWFVVLGNKNKTPAKVKVDLYSEE